ncbi:MAG: helix-hairpin-helix domain-containing protein [bacterium]
MNTHWRTGRLLVVALMALAAGWPAPPRPPVTRPACTAPVALDHGPRAPRRELCGAPLEALTRLCPPTAPIRPGDRLRPRLDGPRCRLDPSPLPAPTRLRLGVRLDLNTATARELTAIPGVGPRTADAIVRGRPWARVDDLIRIRGIGPRRLARYRDRLTASRPPPPPRAPSSPPAASSPRRP